MKGKRVALFWAVLALAVAPAAAGPHKVLTTYDGDATSNLFGAEVVCVGDVDADGWPDFAAGAWGSTGCYVRVWSGADGSVLYTFSDSTGTGFGRGLNGAGDVNADGHADVIVGAPVGRTARVYSGKDGSTLYSYSGSSNTGYGWAVAGVGDLDGDGYDDFAIGARNDANWAGAVYVMSGKDGSSLKTLTGKANASFGNTVAAAGDVNADGVPDLLVGDQWDAYVYSGSDWQVLLYYDESYYLCCVDGAGDVDGDGCDDVILGYTGGGAEYAIVLSGADGSALLTFTAGATVNCFGTSVAAAGDVDGDGYGDFLIGATLGDTSTVTDCGSVRAASGKDGSTIFTLYGEATGDNFGAAVDGLGDLNGDGRAEFIVGAPSTWGAGAGRVYVYESPAPSATVEIAYGAKATAETSVTLSIAWKAGDADVKEMRLRNAGASFGSWTDLEESVEWTLTSGEGPKRVELQVRDADGLTSRVVGDTIIVDQSAPNGSILLEGGADWTNLETLGVNLLFADLQSGVADVRLRSAGEAWSAWRAYSAVVPFELSAGTGQRTVEAQCRDYAGNLSAVAADSIGVDRTPPSGTISIEGGAPHVGARAVRLNVSATDAGGSGVWRMRLKRSDAPQWDGAWLPFATVLDWTLPSQDGFRSVDVQFADRAGNESASFSDGILLDQTSPQLDFLVVNGGRPYVLPEESLEIAVYCHDNPEGAGVDAFRYTVDDGTSWSEWVSLRSGNVAVGRNPAQARPVAVRAVVRDVVGNESPMSPPANVYCVEAEPPYAGAGGSLTGTISDRGDIDAVALDLVGGDLLTIRVKAAATPDKKAAFPLVMDLARPGGERIVEAVTSLAGLVVPGTGRYLLVLRMAGTEGSAQGTYSLSVSVKQAAANAKWKGTATGGEIAFEAARNSLFKASLKGPGLDPLTVVVEGPDGPAPVVISGKPGSAKIAGVLSAGTGIYRIRFAAGGPVTGGWSAKLPKGAALCE